MGIIDRLFRRFANAPGLVGCWHLVQSPDAPGKPAEADFRPDGRLIYSVLSGDRWQIMKLVYRVDADMIVTDQPSHPREERTRFVLERDGSLLLELGGERARFERGPKVAPEP